MTRPLQQANNMTSSKLQTILGQLPGLTPTELGEIRAAVHEELDRQLRTLGVNGDLTEEEWQRLETDSVLGCVKMVRERTGLGLVDSKAYVDRARTRGRRPRKLAEDETVSFAAAPLLEDNGAGLQRDSGGHTFYCPRGCCDTGQDFGNGGRWEGSK